VMRRQAAGLSPAEICWLLLQLLESKERKTKEEEEKEEEEEEVGVAEANNLELFKHEGS
jgi:hypothetical protein